MAHGTYSGGTYPAIHLSTLYPTITITATGAVHASGDAISGGTVSAYTILNYGAVYSSAGDGVHLFAGGAVTNDGANAYVAAYDDAIDITGGIGEITNQGQIQSFGTGATFAGVALAAGGSVANQATGTISGYGYGVDISGAAGTVTNTGKILSTSATPGTPGAGIELSDGGSVTQTGAASLAYGYEYGVAIGGAAGNITNGGKIQATGADGFGIGLGYGGTIENNAGGLIEGYGGGIRSGGSTSIDNSGTIENFGPGVSSLGIELLAGGAVHNEAHALISAYLYGITVSGLAGTVVNDGTIRSTGAVAGAAAVVLAAGGTVANDASAGIRGYTAVVLGGDGVLTNAGTIKTIGGAGSGVVLEAAGTVTNEASASIAGYIGVFAEAGGATVVNYGTIAGAAGQYSVFFAAPGDLLVVEAGATFKGQIGGGQGTLELAAAAGTIAGLGGPGTLSGSAYGTFAGFTDYLFAGATDWTLAGADTLAGGDTLSVAGTLEIAGTLVNDGVILVAGGTLSDATALTGTGTIELSGGATVAFQSGVTGTIDFADATGVLALAAPADASLAIEGFVAGDTIDLTGIAFATDDTVSYGGGHLTIEQNGSVILDMAVTGLSLPGGSVLALQSDMHGGMDIVVTAATPGQLVDDVGTAQLATLVTAIDNLTADVAAAQHIASPSLNIFTPGSLAAPTPAQAAIRGATGTPLIGDVNIANGSPLTAGELAKLAPRVQGLVLTGTTSARMLGHVANFFATTELLVGNLGNDTIRGGGGSGTIISGSGANVIRTGNGDMLVSSGGKDAIRTGTGTDQVAAFGSATVVAGSGLTVFTDEGSAAGAQEATGGSGTTVMTSGLGQDTFIGGSGTSFMNDSGAGRVAFEFEKGVGGFDIVTGFNAASDFILTAGHSFGWSDFQAHETLVGGSTFFDLRGTRIEFVGVTNLTAADFHG